jgi:hypothetical protein
MLASSHCSPAVALTSPSPQKAFVQFRSQNIDSPAASHSSVPPSLVHR